MLGDVWGYSGRFVTFAVELVQVSEAGHLVGALECGLCVGSGDWRVRRCSQVWVRRLAAALGPLGWSGNYCSGIEPRYI